MDYQAKNKETNIVEEVIRNERFSPKKTEELISDYHKFRESCDVPLCQLMSLMVIIQLIKNKEDKPNDLQK